MSRLVLSALSSAAIFIPSLAGAQSPNVPAQTSDHELLLQAQRDIEDLKRKNAELENQIKSLIGQPVRAAAGNETPDSAIKDQQLLSAEQAAAIETRRALLDAVEPTAKDKKDGLKEKGELGTKCSVSQDSASLAVNHARPFSKYCLAPVEKELVDERDPATGERLKRDALKVRWNKYDSIRMGLAFLGSKNDGVAEIAPAYTKRWLRHEDGSDSLKECSEDKHDDRCHAFQSNYLNFRLGVRAPLDPGGKAATFADLTKFERASGLAGFFALEWGDSRWTNFPAAIKASSKTLIAARDECVAEKRNETGDDLANPQFKSDAAILAECTGMSLDAWLADKKHRPTYYAKLIQRPIFGDYSGADDEAPPAHWFAGMEGSYSNATYKFIRLDSFAAGLQQEKHDLYSFKAYGGRGLGSQTINDRVVLDAADLSLSLTYRRDFTFADGTADQDVCAPSDVVIRCNKRNIAPPIELKGFVAGARIAGLFPEFGFFPKLAAEVRGTYDFAANRWGVQVPLYFVVEKGKPNGGIMLSCTGQGHAENGQKLEHDCKGAIFVSTDFKLTQR